MASKLRRVRKYQWVTGKRLRKHGRRKKMQTALGRKIISKRRAKWRHTLTPQRPEKKSLRG